MRTLRSCAVLGLFIVLACGVFPVYAASITVDTLSDGAVAGCSLREAIASANADSAGGNGCADGSGTDVITLGVSGNYTLTTGAELSVTSAVTIQPAAGVTANIQAGTAASTVAWRVFNVNSGDLTLNRVTVRYGGNSFNSNGGCILLGYNPITPVFPSLSMINGAVAEFLEAHPRVKTVLYPGLPSHPQHELAKRQMRGFGGMISFIIDGSESDARSLASKTNIFALAESLGGVESLIEHPYSMTHASTADSEIATDPALIRISVGIEHVDDLIEDLRRALG